MKNKLRPVEEVAEAIKAECIGYHEDTKVKKAITTDRQATHALLREATTRKSVKELFPDADTANPNEELADQVMYKEAYNDAVDDILTLIDDLFSDKIDTNVSHK